MKSIHPRRPLFEDSPAPSAPADTPPSPIPARADLPADATWDLSPLFPSEDAWEAEFNGLDALLAPVLACKDRLSTPAEVLALFTAEEAKDIKIFHTLPDRIPEEINVKTTYRVGFFLPFSLFKAIFGAPVPSSGTKWRGNAFKCGDKTSKPHWLCWNPIGKCNFHTPEFFGELIFG